MQENSFSRNSLISFFTRVIVFVFGFITFIIITRVLGPEGKGIYSLVLLVPALMLNFGNFGIGSANVYFTGKKKYKIQDIISNSLISAILFGSFLIVLFGVLLQFSFFQKFIHYDQLPHLYLWIVVFSIPVSLLLGFFQNIIRGKGEITNYNKTKMLESILGFIAIFVLLIVLKRGIFGAVFSSIFAVFGATLFTIILVKKISRIRLSFNKKLFKDSAVYGGKVYIANTVSFLNYRLDMFLIALFLNPAIAVASVGFYSISVGIAEKLFMIPGAFSTVLFPKISSIKSSEADDFTPKVVRHTFFIMLISCLFLFFLAKPLITIIFGSVFLPAVLPLIILLPGIIAFGIGGVLAADLSGRGKPQFAIYSSIACLIVNVILNIILIPKLGISGAAFASSIAYWINTIIILRVFLKISKKPLTEVLLIKSEDFQDYYRLFFNLKNWVKTK